jgi:hypothetical protein
VADGTDLATAILDVSVQSQSGLKAHRNVYGGIVDWPRLWRAAPALAPAAGQRLRTIEQVAAKATKRSARA